MRPGQVVSGQLRLPPPSAVAPEQFPPTGLLATIVFCAVNVPARTRMAPPEPFDEFPEKVLFATITVPAPEIPPPPPAGNGGAPSAEFPEKVLLTTLSEPLLAIAPPLPHGDENWTEFAVKVLLATLSVAPL